MIAPRLKTQNGLSIGDNAQGGQTFIRTSSPDTATRLDATQIGPVIPSEDDNDPSSSRTATSGLHQVDPSETQVYAMPSGNCESLVLEFEQRFLKDPRSELSLLDNQTRLMLELTSNHLILSHKETQTLRDGIKERLIYEDLISDLPPKLVDELVDFTINALTDHIRSYREPKTTEVKSKSKILTAAQKEITSNQPSSSFTRTQILSISNSEITDRVLYEAPTRMPNTATNLVFDDLIDYRKRREQFEREVIETKLNKLIQRNLTSIKAKLKDRREYNPDEDRSEAQIAQAELEGMKHLLTEDILQYFVKNNLRSDRASNDVNPLKNITKKFFDANFLQTTKRLSTTAKVGGGLVATAATFAPFLPSFWKSNSESDGKATVAHAAETNNEPKPRIVKEPERKLPRELAAIQVNAAGINKPTIPQEKSIAAVTPAKTREGEITTAPPEITAAAEPVTAAEEKTVTTKPSEAVEVAMATSTPGPIAEKIVEELPPPPNPLVEGLTKLECKYNGQDIKLYISPSLEPKSQEIVTHITTVLNILAQYEANPTTIYAPAGTEPKTPEMSNLPKTHTFIIKDPESFQKDRENRAVIGLESFPSNITASLLKANSGTTSVINMKEFLPGEMYANGEVKKTLPNHGSIATCIIWGRPFTLPVSSSK